MNNRRHFGPVSQDGAPTMAAPAAGQQQGAWPQQAPYGGAGAYQPYGQQPPDLYYNQQPPMYGQQAQDPAQAPEDPGEFKDPETGADTRGKADTPPPVDKHNPGDPANPTPDDLLCHPNPPGCTGDQKAPAQPAP